MLRHLPPEMSMHRRRNSRALSAPPTVSMAYRSAHPAIVFWNAGRITKRGADELRVAAANLPASVHIIALAEVFSPDFPTSLPDLSSCGFPTNFASVPHYPNVIPPRQASGGAAFYFRESVQWLQRHDITGDCAHGIFVQCNVPSPCGHSMPMIIGSIYRHAKDDENQSRLHAAMARALAAVPLHCFRTDPSDSKRNGGVPSIPVPLLAVLATAASDATVKASAALADVSIADQRFSDSQSCLRILECRFARASSEPSSSASAALTSSLAKQLAISHAIIARLRADATAADRLARTTTRARDAAADALSRFSAFVRSPIPVLFLGDFNARSADFGDDVSNDDGDHLSQFCDAHGLSVLNNVFAHGVPTHGSSVLDLAITNSPAHFSDLIVGADSAVFAGDHLPISVVFSTAAPATRAAFRSTAIRWELLSADWPRFTAKCAAIGDGVLARCQQIVDGTPMNPVRDGFYRRNGLAVAASPFVPASIPGSPACASETLPRVERLWGEVRDALLSAGHATIATTPLHRRSPAFRFSRVLPSLLRDLRRCRNRYRKYGRDDDREAAVAARREFRKEFDEARQRAFEAMCEGVGDQSVNWRRMPLSRKRSSDGALFTVAARSSAPDPPVDPLLADSAAPHDAADDVVRLPLSIEARALNIVAAAFAANGTLPPDDRDVSLISECGDGDNCPPVGLNRLCNDDIAFDEVDGAIGCVRLRGAPGADSIPNHFIRHAPPSLRRSIHLLVSTVFACGVRPLEWRSANVCALHKGHDAPASDSNSYRPIALTSTVGKLDERVILARLRAVLGARIHSAQYGFRKSMATGDALHRVRSAIVERLTRSQSHLSVAFLDISKAFDRTWHAAVLLKLWRLGVHGRLWRWVRAFLTDRRIRVIYGGRVSDWFAINAGVPQGAVVSPELFNAFINDLPELDRLHHVLFALYADDIALWAKPCVNHRNSSHRDKAIRLTAEDMRLNRGIKAIGAWAAEWRVTFGVAKCGIVRFFDPRRHHGRAVVAARGTRHRSVYELLDEKRADDPLLDIPIARPDPNDPTAEPDRIGRVYPRLHGTRLPQCSSYNYLGVTLAANLSWDEQCEKVIKKVRAASSLIIRLIRRDAPPRFACIRQLVTSLVLPIIGHGAHVWHPFTSKFNARSRNARRILSALIQPLRIALGLPATPSFHALLAECGIPDVLSFFHRHVVAFVARAAALPVVHPTHQLVKTQLNGVGPPDNRVFPSLREALNSFFPRRTGAFAPCVVHAGFQQLPGNAVGSCARLLTTAALQSSFRRWQAMPIDACRDLVALRSPPRPLTLALARRIEKGVCGRAFPCRGMAGVPAYLRVFSKSASVLCARLRLNRSLIGDSMFRRHFTDVHSADCDRCGVAGVRDTVFHFLYDCAGDNTARAPLAATRALPLLRELFLTVPADECADLLLGDPPPRRSPADASRFLSLLGLFYERIAAMPNIAV